MDEGTLLAYPDRILKGAFPHRDFTTPYGPGGFWLLAGVFELFGSSPYAERAVGLCYRLLIVGLVFAIALPARLAVASASGLVCGIVLLRLDLLASTALGAIAFALLGFALARCAANGAAARGLPFGAGLSLGVAVVFRADFALAVLLGALPAAVALRSSARRWLAVGVVVSLALYMPDAIASWDRIGQLLADAYHAAPGRRLPLPTLSTDVGQLFTGQALCTALALTLGGLSVRRPRLWLPARPLLSVGLFAAGLQPWVLSRPDVGHAATIAAGTVALAPFMAATTLSLAGAGGRARRVPTFAGLCTAAAIIGLLAPGIIRGELRVHLARLFGARDAAATVIRHGDRWFAVGPSARPQALRAMIGDVERESSPGDRLFVGTGDLRRTPYVDTFLYYLLPELVPATFYMEFSPGSANRRGSGLARELGTADLVLLNRRWDGWNEPNDSAKLGPAAPNRVLRRLFCLRSRRGPYELYVRCSGGRHPTGTGHAALRTSRLSTSRSSAPSPRTAIRARPYVVAPARI